MGLARESWPVLVVEDDHEIRESLIDILEDEDIAVVAATNGRDALDKLNRVGGKVCLVLLDMMMPVLDGVGFRDEQILDPRLAGIPVVVMSAYLDVSATAESLGAVGFLRKPFSVAQVLDAIGKHAKQP